MDNKDGYQHVKTGPRFFYGYVVVVAAFLVMVVSWGVYDAFGVFFNPLLAEFGWTRAVTSGAFSLSMIIYGVLGIVVGGLNDRLGPRVVVTICGFLLGLGYLLMSQVSALWQLHLFYGVIVGVGMSGVWVPQLSTVARWFVSRRSLMTGIVIAGVGIGGLVGPPVISRLIATYDWRLSYVILGSVVLLVMILAAQFLRRDPARMGQMPYGESEEAKPGLKSEAGAFTLGEAVRTPQFWQYFFILFCMGFCVFTIMVHIVPHVIELGISATTAANILAVNGGVSILGNYVLGVVADRIGNRWIFVISFILIVVTLFLLIPARELWMLFFLAIVFGFAFGGSGTVESPLAAGLFGLSSHGLIYGVVHLGFTIGAAAGPLVTGHIFDLTGSYQMAFLVCASLGVVGLVLAVILRPTRKIGGRI